MGSDDHFLLLLSFLILETRALDTVGRARRYPFAEIAFIIFIFKRLLLLLFLLLL